MFIFIAMGFAGGLLNIAWTYMQRSFGVDIRLLGVLLVCATTGNLVAAFLSGTVVSRFGLSAATTGGAVLIGVGLFLIALSPTWGLLLAAVVVMSLGRGTLDVGMNNFVSENFQTASVNLLHACWGIGLTFAPGLLTVLLVTYEQSWRVGYLVLAAVHVVIFGLVVWQWGNWDAPDEDEPRERVNRAGALDSLRRPAVLWSMLVFFVYGGVELGVGQLSNTLLVESRAVSQGIASFWISMYWGSFTVGRLLVGVVAMRIADRRLMWFGMGSALSGTVLLTFAGSLVANLAGLMLCGFGLAGFFPILIAHTPGRIPRAHVSNAIGFQVGSSGLGAAVLPGLIGAFTPWFGLEFIAVGLLINAVLLVGVYRGLAVWFPAQTAPVDAA